MVKLYLTITILFFILFRFHERDYLVRSALHASSYFAHWRDYREILSAQAKTGGFYFQIKIISLEASIFYVLAWHLNDRGFCQ